MRACVWKHRVPAIGVWMKLRKCICLYVALEGKTEHFCESLDSNVVHLVSRIFRLFGVVRLPGLWGGIFWALTHLWRCLLNRSLGKNIWNRRNIFFAPFLSPWWLEASKRPELNASEDLWCLDFIVAIFLLEETWQRNIFIVQVSTLQRKFSLCNLKKKTQNLMLRFLA